MLKPVLAIMARVPSKEGKSRLGNVLSPARREVLQWALLEDTLDKIRLMTEFKSYLAATPANEIDHLTRVVGANVKVITQPDGNLGQRMMGVAKELFLNGHEPVILIGTDAPALPPSYLIKALYLLERNDLVFGPAFDGGYYLIGMRRFEESVFNGISWGSETVLEETIKICDKNKLAYRLLEYLMDIDRPADLQALLAQYENNQMDFTPLPARTIQFLKSVEGIKINKRLIKKKAPKWVGLDCQLKK